jgi:hypothetical protein
MSAWEWVGVGVAGYLAVSAVATLFAVIVGWAITRQGDRVPGGDGGGPLDDHGVGGVEPWEPTRLDHVPRAAPRRHRREMLIVSAILLTLGTIFGVAEWTATAFVIIVGALILAAGA